MLTGDLDRLSEYDLHTRAKVASDELRELIARFGTGAEEADATVLAATKEAESAIVRGRTVSESSEILATEFELLDFSICA